jgi:hypothetical protein
MCVFHQESYIELLKLLILSIYRNGNIQQTTTDILIITSPLFQPLIQKKLEKIKLPIRYYLLDLHTLMESSCCKLRIFNYEHIDKYQKLLYLDTDVLINSDMNVLFDRIIPDNKLHTLEEGSLGDDLWGLFFDKSTIDPATPAFSAGVFYFTNSPVVKAVFEAANAHINSYMKTHQGPPGCLDQPFVVYHSFMHNAYDNQFMKPYLENNPSQVTPERIIYHFPGGPGSFRNKYLKMTHFLSKMVTRFDTRNAMIEYYCDQLVNPRLLEIGVFRGEFLDYIVKHCAIESIDAVDLFEGITCSGNVDGNYVVEYDVGKSYVELCEKYKHVSDHIRIHKSDSSTFLKNVATTYDIIYIDGDHSYEGVKKDLVAAYLKIKNGGYIMGHDYEMNMKKAKFAYQFGVKQAVDEFCAEYKQTILSKAYDGCVSYCIKINRS